MNISYKFFCLLMIFTSINKQAKSQSFVIYCDTQKIEFKGNPFVFLPENLFDYRIPSSTIDLKTKNKSFVGAINLQRPVFISLINTELLAIPNKEVNGTLKRFGNDFFIPDTNDINRFLRDVNDSIVNIVNKYDRRREFSDFLILFDSLKNFINGRITYLGALSAKKRYNIDLETMAAINQYMKIRLAHFSLYPIFSDKDKNRKELYKLVEQNFEKINSNYWLQVQWGKIFIRTYFTKILLPLNNNNLEKAFSSSRLYKNKDFKNYATYHYFLSCLANDSTSNNLNQIKKEFSQFETENKFTGEDENVLKKLKNELIRSGSNIIPLFSKQELVNEKGQFLTSIEKNALLRNRGNIVIYYWASWCSPCISFIKTLQSDEIVYKGEKYKFVFISTDKNQQNWLSRSYPAVHSKNSFRITDLQNDSFYKTFQVTAIPRLFLIKNGILINQNFEKEKF